MYKILDKVTGQFIRGVPCGNNEVTEYDLSENGRVFKRKSDLSNHINEAGEFYQRNKNRLVIVEYEFTEINRTTFDSALQAKNDRDKAKKVEEKKRQVAYKLQEIERVKAELARLTGKD